MYHEGETITYQRRGGSWMAVSGYREGFLPEEQLGLPRNTVAHHRAAVPTIRQKATGPYRDRDRAPDGKPRLGLRLNTSKLELRSRGLVFCISAKFRRDCFVEMASRASA